MKASSTSFGSAKFSSRTLTSITSAPNDRNAFETPRPVASETSRSEPGPPISTAILLGKSLVVMSHPSRCQHADWVAHASRVLVAASRRKELLINSQTADEVARSEKV